MEGIKTIFGANIKHYRKKLRISQEQLAEKLDITQKHLSSIETGANFVSVEFRYYSKTSEFYRNWRQFCLS